MLAGVGFGMGEGDVRDWSRAVDEACTKRINYFNDRPFWRVSKRPVRSIEVTGYRLRQYLKNMPYFIFFPHTCLFSAETSLAGHTVRLILYSWVRVWVAQLSSGKGHLQLPCWRWLTWFFFISLHMSRFVSVGDALGRERPATPMSSYFAGHSRYTVT